MDQRIVYRYVDEQTPDDEDLTCPICLEFLVEPVLHKNCGRMFCGSCLQDQMNKITKCPLCREDIAIGTVERQTTKLVLKKLDGLKVKCPDCDQIFERGNLSSHIKQCAKMCGNGCGVLVSPNQLHLHDSTCSFVEVSCGASDVGCNVKIVRKEIERHHAVCALFKARPLLLPQVTRITDLERALQRIEKQHNDLVKFNQRIIGAGRGNNAPGA